MQRHHLPALAQVRELRLVALACTNASALAQCAANGGVERLYRHHAGLLADPDVEVVGVCVPAESHVEVAGAALAAGLHVLIEKPPALGLEEWDRLIQVGATSPAVALLGFNMRWLPSVRAARNAIRSGTIGDVRAMQTTMTSDRRAKRETHPWRADRLSGGGALVEKAVHHIDLWRFLLDSEVEEVRAVTTVADEDVSVTGRMENGVLVTTVTSDCLPYRHEVQVLGTRGHLHLFPDRHPGVTVRRDPPPGRRDLPRRAVRRWVAGIPARADARRSGGAYLGSFASEWRSLASAARFGTRPEPGLESGRRLLQTILAAAASASSGTAVRRVDAPDSLAPPG